jgi:hypothetical protein
MNLLEELKRELKQYNLENLPIVNIKNNNSFSVVINTSPSGVPYKYSVNTICDKILVFAQNWDSHVLDNVQELANDIKEIVEFATSYKKVIEEFNNTLKNIK